MKRFLFLSVFTILLLVKCTSDQIENKQNVVVGVPADIESLIPLFAFSYEEGNISELLFQSLVQHRWDYEKAELISEPMLAVNWEWTTDSSSIIVNIKENVLWSDSVKLTVQDIVFSFDLYSDPAVQSRALGYFENFYTDEKGRIDIEKTFEISSDYSVKINFAENSSPSLTDIDHPILPKHALESIERSQLVNSEFNQKPITSGPFKLTKWVRNQAIFLEADKTSGFFNPGSINGIIFKIVPEYTSRLLQLINGELDLVENIKPEDVKRLQQNDRIDVIAVGGRQYDYIGWNSIEIWEGQTRPNRFFSNRNVRKALTHALNREEIVKEYLYNYGKLSAGPVSPLYKGAIDESTVPLDYDPELAKQILSNEGWYDTDGNGILDKEGLEFSFDMYVPSGNPRRKFAATLFKNELRAIGVDVNIVYLEFGAFMDGLFIKQYDSWMAGWQTPLPINLKIQWHSNSNLSPMNFTSYKNAKVDELLTKLDENISREEYFATLNNINKIIYDDQPFAFLYWINNANAFNNKIVNIDFNPLGVIHHCWEWSIK